MKLGDTVTCFAYIKPSGNCYEKMADGCYYHEHGKNEEVDIEGERANGRDTKDS